MAAHLDERTLDDYLAGTLGSSDLRATDAHLGACLTCSLLVEREGLSPARWERRGLLGRLVAVKPVRQQARPEERVAA